MSPSPMVLAPLMRPLKSVFFALLVLGLSIAPSGSAQAQSSTRSFHIAGANQELSDVTGTVNVYFESLRPNPATRQWTFELKVRNASAQPVQGPLVVLFTRIKNAGQPSLADGQTTDSLSWFNLTSWLPSTGLGSGEASRGRTVTLPFGVGVPQIDARVFAVAPASGPSYALVRTLDELGQSLGSVRIQELGDSSGSERHSDARFGIATLAGNAGPKSYRFETPGHLPVWRTLSFIPGALQEIPSPRLTRRDSQLFNLSPLGGQVPNRDGTVRLTIPPGALSKATPLHLTMLTPQTLPAFLPVGWSPLSQFWLEFSTNSWTGTSFPVQLTLTDTVAPVDVLRVVRWNEATLQWITTQEIAGQNSRVVQTTLEGDGAWAIVVVDRNQPLPSPASIGLPLPSLPINLVDWTAIGASGEVTPATSPASLDPENVTALGTLTLTNRLGTLPSGLLVKTFLRDRYELNDASVRVAPQIEAFLVGYQRPGLPSPNTLRAETPLRPRLLHSAEQLVQGLIQCQVHPPDFFNGKLLTTANNVLEAGPVQIEISAAFLDKPQLSILSAESLGSFTNLLPAASGVPRAGFEWSMGPLTEGAEPQLHLSTARPGENYVLAELLTDSLAYGPKPVGRYVAETNGVLRSLEPSTGARLPGLTGSGLYVLIQVPAPLALVQGTARTGDGTATDGLIVRLPPWTTRSQNGGSYQLLAPRGSSRILLESPRSSERIVRPVVIPDSLTATEIALTLSNEPPALVHMQPAPGATNQPVLTAITLEFSKPIQLASTLGEAITLQSTRTNRPLETTRTWNPSGTVLSLLPIQPLDPDTTYEVRLTRSITDLAGIPLASEITLPFVTRPAATNTAVSVQLISYEPTNGVTRLRGMPGLAEPGQPVVFVNETTGRTSTTTARPDGSFEGTIEASIEDTLRVTLINANGTANSIGVNRQVFRDGSVALFEEGGTIEIPGEHGTIEVRIEPGSLAGKTQFRFESIPLTEARVLSGNIAPESGKILGGLKVSAIRGNPMSESMDISFPVDVADMQLPPGVSPTNCGFGLAISRQINGVQVFELVDRMHFESGRLVTHSPPFYGLFGPFEDILVLPLLMFVAETPLLVHGRVYAAYVDPQTGIPPRGAHQEFLAGAIVSGRGKSQAIDLRGRLNPGTVYASTGPSGKYTLMVVGDATSAAKPALVFATHPRFPNATPRSIIPDLSSGDRLAIGNLLNDRDIVFPKNFETTDVVPSLAITQSPLNPAAGTEAIVSILSTDDSSVPEILGEVTGVSALPNGGLPSRADVRFLEGINESAGANARRREFVVKSDRAQLVTLGFTATDANGNERRMAYALAFGATPPLAQENPPPSDPQDHTRPYVLGMTPSPGSAGLSPAQPIRLRFNEAIRRESLQYPGLVSVDPPAGSPIFQLSPDQTELSVLFPQLKPDTTYTLTLGFGAQDLNFNPIDQDPVQTGSQAFSATLRTAPAVQVSLETHIGPRNGAGAVVMGNHALVAEQRGSQRGRVAVFDLTRPAEPQLVGEITTPPFPRAMLLLPRYAFAYTNGLSEADGRPMSVTIDTFTNLEHPNHSVRTNDLLILVGGLAGQGQLQWIRAVDVSNPRAPQLIAGMVISLEGFYLPGRLRWSGPILSYMETGSPDRISLLNLQSLIIADILSSNQKEYRRLPDNGDPGLDANGDGDFVDPGDRVPLPAHLPVEFGGKEFALALPDTDQPIADYVLQDAGSYIGVIVGAGRELGADGRPQEDRPVRAAFRTLLHQGLALPREGASFEFPANRSPRRVEALFQYPVASSNGIALRDWIFVSLRGSSTAGDTNNYLAVLDVTDRLAVSQVVEVPLPKDGPEGNSYSIQRRDDGLIAVAGDAVTYLLDPSRFQETPRGNGSHPALIGLITGVGGSAREFATTLHGIHVAPDVLDKAQLVQTAPVLAFMGFNQTPPFAPSTLATRSESDLDALFQRSEPRSYLLPARLQTTGECGQSTVVTNLDSRVHHYVVVHAPGGAGPVIQIALESLNASGVPLRPRGFLFPPVHAMSPESLQGLAQVPGANDAPVRPLEAWRASNDPLSPYFNVYVSRPFVLVAGETSKQALLEIQSQLDREVLWSGHSLRASLDPALRGNPALGPFAGTLHSQDHTLRPGVEVVASSFPADLIPSPNPGPVTGEMMLPVALNSVGAHNSELVINATDLVLSGRRMAFEFRRTFRGQSLYEGPFGRGWDFNYNQRLIEVPQALECLPLSGDGESPESEVARGGDLLFHTGGGQIVVWKFAGTNAPATIASDPLIQSLGWLSKATRYYLPPSGLFSPLLRFQDGRFVRLEPDGMQYWFTPQGRLETIKDRFEKNFFSLHYNLSGELLSIQDDRKQSVEFGYYKPTLDAGFRAGIDELSLRAADFGKICRMRDGSGRDVRYYYSDDGLLDRYEGPEVSTGPDDTFKGRTRTRYYYSDTSNPTRTAQSLIGIGGDDEGGAPVLAIAEHGTQGRDTVSKLNLMGQSIRIAQPHTNTTAGLAASSGPTRVTSQDNSVSRVQFDRFGRVTEAVLEGVAGIAATNRQDYFESGPLRGLVRATVSPLGDRTEFVYDEQNPSLRSKGNLIAIRKIPGERGGPILEATTEYDAHYNLVSGLRRDFNGNETTVVLAPDRRSVERISKAGERELFAVNEFGQPQSHTSMEGIVTSFDYNAEGHLSSRTIGTRQTRFLYTPISTGSSDPGLRGKPSHVIDPSGQITTFIHDELDRPVIQEQGGATITSSFDAAGNLLRRTTTVDANLQAVEEFHYLSHGFLREQRLRNVETLGATQDLVTSFERDELNRIKTITLPSGEQHRLRYDYQGRLERDEVPGSHTNIIAHDAVGNVTNIVRGTSSESYSFDGHNRLVTAVAGNRTRTELRYDNNGNLTTNQVLAADGTRLSEVHMAYDALNRLHQKSLLRDDGESVLTTEYNSTQRTLSVTDALGAMAKTFLDEEGRPERIEAPTSTVTLRRDRSSNVIVQQTEDAGGTFHAGFGFNERNQLTALTNALGEVSRYRLGLDGRQLAIQDRRDHTTTNVFTLLGEIATQTKPNGVIEHHQFDAGRNLALFADAVGNQTRYIHDGLNRMVTNRLPNGAETVFSAFNAFGEPGTLSMPRGIRVEAKHDDEGKLTNRIVTGLGPRREETYVYDGLRRLKRVTDPSGTLAFQFDLSGYIRNVERRYMFGTAPVERPPLEFSIRQTADPALYRKQLTYPIDGALLHYGRDASGRLNSLALDSGEPIVQTTQWLGNSRVAERIYGQNRIRLSFEYDGLPRIVARRYENAGTGQTLVDVRQAYDPNGAVLARQYIHRNARTDLFHYDAGYRVTRADHSARPAFSGESSQAGLPGFSVPEGLVGHWVSGSYARTQQFDATEGLRSIATLTAPSVEPPPIITQYNGFNEFLAPLQVDGFTRTTDAIGNITRTPLLVRLPNRTAPERVVADLTYNDLGQLVRIDREDGVQLYMEYDANGLRIRRVVRGPEDRCIPSDLGYLYDGQRLLEERDLACGALLLRRYYYTDDGDEIAAVDARSAPESPLERFYLLTDNQRSVLAVATASGTVSERRLYDTWGQPSIEARDTTAPAISLIQRETNGLLIVFSEPVAPRLQGTRGVLTALPSLVSSLQLKAANGDIAGQLTPDDNSPRYLPGSVYRFTPVSALPDAVQLHIAPSSLVDEWGNAIAEVTVPLDLRNPEVTVLFQGTTYGATAPESRGRFDRGLGIGFHGQYHDEDSGLLYCRARYYDPYSAQFLQRDPAGFVDGVNPYVAFANNPVSYRDPTGASIADDMRQMGETLQEDAEKHRQTGGFVNLLLSMAEDGAGGLLQMPAATRDSWNVLQSESQGGTLDLLNRMKAAEVVGKAPVAAVGVAASGLGVLQSFRTATSFLAQRAQGLASAISRRARMALGRGTAIDFLMTQGLTRWEAEGYINTIALMRDHYKSDSVEAAVRGFGSKAALRRENRERLMAVKPEWAKTKTAGVDASVNITLKQADGSLIHREFTGDLDFYYVKVNGRRLEEHEFQQFKHVFNREMNKAYRRMGGTGNPGASVLHGTHMNLPSMYGKRVEHLGADIAKKPFYQRKGGGEAIYEMLPHSQETHYDLELFEKIKGPGADAFSVHVDGMGRVKAFNPAASQLRREIDEVLREFRWQTGIELGTHGWYTGFEETIPASR